MKLGILGGTFNPIHNAHLRIARLYAEQLGLDRLLLIPTHIPPHKQAPDLASAEDRLTMCRLAAAGEPGIEVSDYEVRHEGRSYTIDTLEHLRRQHPQAELYLLMGADMFLALQNWRSPRHIIELAVLCAAPREPGEQPQLEEQKRLLEAAGARCLLLQAEAMPLSSTQVREILRHGGDVSALLPPAVLGYIREKGLYAG